LGEIGSLEGTVFNNWTQCDKIPKDAEFISYGLDWGFTNDPTSLIEVYRYESKIYVNELLYQTQLTNSDIVAKLKAFNVNTSQCIVADSAEPKSIQDLTNAGYYVEPARKGPDSIKASIDRLQQYEIVVTKNSLNLIKELRQYKWAKDREGKALNAPEDVMNHAIDCLRYVGLNKLSQFENSGDYSFADSEDW
jgi:phage terminase large subunit